MKSRSSSTKRSSAARGKKVTRHARSSEWKGIERQLERAAKEQDTALRGVRIAAAIARALKEIGQEPILVGGAAVEFYTHGAYTTRDIDMVAPGGPKLIDIMTRLGFDRMGKDFIHRTLNIYIEFPSAFLSQGETASIIEIDGIKLEIISIEDLIVDRLCAYKFWKSGIDGVNAMILMELSDDDRTVTERKAQLADVLDAMDHVRLVLECTIRKKLSRAAAAELVEKFIRR